MRAHQMILVAVAVLSICQPTFAANINDAFLANEVPNGSETLTFAGPEGGTISLGFYTTPSTPASFSQAGLIHEDARNGTETNIEGWNADNLPILAINTLGSVKTLSFASFAANEIFMHPNTSQAAVVRYTVATTGEYDITGSFSNSSGVTVTEFAAVDILLNGTSILSAGAGSDATPFSELGVSLTAGDLLDFVVDEGPAGVGNDSTGLFANVAQVVPAPEPSTFILAVISLLSLGLMRRRSRS